MKKPIFALLCLCSAPVCIQGSTEDSLAIDIETQGSFSNSNTPLWLNANKYGLSSLNASNGYLRGMASYGRTFGKVKMKAETDVVLPVGYKLNGCETHYTQKYIVHQAYLQADWKYGVLTIGAKEQPMELKNNELSSGSQTLGINSQPIPQVRIGLNDYWPVPYSKGWLAFKGHAAFGVMMDADWQREAAKRSMYKYNRGTRYHEKSGYLRIGNEEKFPLSFTVGLEMAAQFGGSVYSWTGTDENGWVGGNIRLEHGLKNYVYAFFGFGSDGDTGEDVYSNSEGNLLGSWVARLNWKDENIEVGAYVDHFFEDHSGLFFLDYDGYGSGSKWDDRVDSRYFRYDLKDALWGIDVKLKKFPYVNQAVVEYINTRYQSGPIYHDHTQSVQTHIGGRDNYYNHAKLSGWQHWGQVIGNPLFTSPGYNTDGSIYVKNNRFNAWHFALAGNPVEGLHYRAKLTWEKGLGTYDKPYYTPRTTTSLLLEGTYSFPENSALGRLSMTLAYGQDHGDLLGDNSGLQVTFKYKIK